MRRAVVCFVAMLASGCFHWAPISSLSSVDDDRILVQEPTGPRVLVHATANDRVIEAREEIGGRPVIVDPLQSQVLVRRLNGPATAAIIGASALGVAGTIGVIAFIIATITRPVFEGAPK